MEPYNLKFPDPEYPEGPRASKDYEAVGATMVMTANGPTVRIGVRPRKRWNHQLIRKHLTPTGFHKYSGYVTPNVYVKNVPSPYSGI